MIFLSAAQKQVVNASIGIPMQVLASAGSGKTRVLTERVRYLINNTKKDSIVALTFTNKAAEEMQDRLGKDEKIENRCWIATIHSVAQRILEKYGHTLGLPSELHIYEREKDRMEVFLHSLREQGINIDEYLEVADVKQKKDRERVMQKYLDDFSIIKRELLNYDDVINKFPNNPRLWGVYQDYQSALIESGGIDYDDILVYAHKLLLDHEWIGNIYRAKYKHICVDEAQDLNKAQYEFIKSFCGDSIKSIMMVGDPNQMIYGFNGSSIKYLCECFLADFNPIIFEIKENFRSSKAIIKVANKLKSNAQNEMSAALIGKVEFIECTDENEEAIFVKDKILDILSMKNHPEIEGDITLEHMVVIARNRFVFSSLEKKLAEENIPFHLRKAERSADPTSVFGKILDHGIRLKLNPKDWVDGKKLCSAVGIPAPKKWGDEGILLKLSQSILLSDSVNKELYSQLLIEINNIDAENPSVRKFTKIFFDKLSNLAILVLDEKNKSEVERSIQELNEFQQCWTRFKAKGLGESLQTFRNAIALGQLSDDMVRGGLILSTVHTMKGLEKDIVFIIGMCEGVFPDYRAKTEVEIHEERNNAFVAVTRAKRWLFISYPKQRMMPWGSVRLQNKSRFISEME
ncbi:ATP-dependent helicase [Yersinia enterocolitica]|uniref:ATP-dependent helicase n=1 Tax=Yersinia enterocolitica TaxID=630 RepID=UPI0030CCF18B